MSSEPSRDDRFDEILAEYLEGERAGQAPDRTELLARNPEFAAELAAFFADHDRLKHLAGPATVDLPDNGADPVPGEYLRYFGDYELLEKIAHGGMGVVYRARQISLNRTVALKMILAGQLATLADVQRFRTEAENAAGLDHPNIVPLYEVGDHDGRQYYTMKLIEGGDLRTVLSRQSSVVGRERQQWAANLVATVARAVHYAHQRGILHRDLKPANILLQKVASSQKSAASRKRENSWVTDHCLLITDYSPHVTDFGLAKRIRTGEPVTSATGGTAQTLSGAIVGTPNYMAPEQASPGADPLTVAADIYGLGAILYELLTGRPPFSGADALEVLRKVNDEEPRRPQSLNPNIDADLQTICMKCLRKEPGKRYASAEALAEDLERWMKGEPIQARPVRQLERAVKWVRRNKVVAGLGAALVVTLICGTTFAWYFGLNAAHWAAENEANSARALGSARRAEMQRYIYCMRMVQQAWNNGRVERIHELLEAQRPEHTSDDDLRGFEWYYWKNQCRKELARYDGSHAVFSPDGGRVLIGGRDSAGLWDVTTGAQLLSLQGYSGGTTDVVFSADGTKLATASTGMPVTIWSATTGKKQMELIATSGWGLAFSPDGRRLAVAVSKGELCLFDVENGRKLFGLDADKYSKVNFSPDGTRIAGPSGSSAIIRTSNSGDKILELTGHSGELHDVAFSPDGRRIATGSDDGTARVWDGINGQVLFTLKGHTGPVFCIAFSPDGRRLASGSADLTVRIWDAITGENINTLKGFEDNVLSLSFSPAGDRLVVGSEDETVRTWDVSPGLGPIVLPSDRSHRLFYAIMPSALSPNGSRFLAKLGNAFQLVDTVSAERILSIEQSLGSYGGFAIGGGGKILAFWSAALRSIHLWDLPRRQERLAFQPKGHDRICRIAISPDEKFVASGTEDGNIGIWDAADGHEVIALHGHRGTVSVIAFSTDSQFLASGSSDGYARIWNASTGELLYVLGGDTGQITSVAISPTDNRLLASGSSDSNVRIWNLTDGREQAILSAHRYGVSAVTFSPDGRRLATGSDDDTVRVWDTYTGQELLVFNHGRKVAHVAFSSDGKTLFSASCEGRIRRWETERPSVHEQGHRFLTWYVRSLWHETMLRDQVIFSLQNDRSLNDEDRTFALDQAVCLCDFEPYELNNESWRAVRHPRRGLHGFELALRQAQAACEQKPNDGTYLNTLGIAQYRCGLYKEALETLTKSDQFNAKENGSIPADLAFLAMAHHHLGNKDEGKKLLERLREAMKKGEPSEDARAFLKEAEELIEGQQTATDR